MYSFCNVYVHLCFVWLCLLCIVLMFCHVYALMDLCDIIFTLCYVYDLLCECFDMFMFCYVYVLLCSCLLMLMLCYVYVCCVYVLLWYFLATGKGIKNKLYANILENCLGLLFGMIMSASICLGFVMLRFRYVYVSLCSCYVMFMFCYV